MRLLYVSIIIFFSHLNFSFALTCNGLLSNNKLINRKVSVTDIKDLLEIIGAQMNSGTTHTVSNTGEGLFELVRGSKVMNLSSEALESGFLTAQDIRALSYVLGYVSFFENYTGQGSVKDTVYGTFELMPAFKQQILEETGLDIHSLSTVDLYAYVSGVEYLSLIQDANWKETASNIYYQELYQRLAILIKAVSLLKEVMTSSSSEMSSLDGDRVMFMNDEKGIRFEVYLQPEPGKADSFNPVVEVSSEEITGQIIFKESIPKLVALDLDALHEIMDVIRLEVEGLIRNSDYAKQTISATKDKPNAPYRTHTNLRSFPEGGIFKPHNEIATVNITSFIDFFNRPGDQLKDFRNDPAVFVRKNNLTYVTDRHGHTVLSYFSQPYSVLYAKEVDLDIISSLAAMPEIDVNQIVGYDGKPLIFELFDYPNFSENSKLVESVKILLETPSLDIRATDTQGFDTLWNVVMTSFNKDTLDLILKRSDLDLSTRYPNAIKVMKEMGWTIKPETPENPTITEVLNGIDYNRFDQQASFWDYALERLNNRH